MCCCYLNLIPQAVAHSFFWEMCQSKLELAVPHSAHGAGAVSSPLTSGIFVVESSLWHACQQQMGTLCCSCLHVMVFLAHSSNFFSILSSLWASLKIQCISHLWTDTFSYAFYGFLMNEIQDLGSHWLALNMKVSFLNHFYKNCLLKAAEERW